MIKFNQVKAHLAENKYQWLVTGCAGFIGSNLVEELLKLDQKVIGLDNFSTGKKENLANLKLSLSEKWKNFTFIEGCISDLETCQGACANVDYILHQAALGSVPRSVNDPISSHHSNLTGFINMMTAAKDVPSLKKFVYASSSSVYGDEKTLPKVESKVGKVLSPYAATKMSNEIYADAFYRSYGLKLSGLRYFNVFGRRQDPDGAYAAVIPRWIKQFIDNENVYINGDGTTSRDFSYIDNIIQINILAAVCEDERSFGEAFNCAYGEKATLNELFAAIKEGLVQNYPHVADIEPTYRDFRPGDVKHSLADISKAQEILGYEPTHSFKEGLTEALDWYCKNL